MTLYLGLDVSTTATKALLIDMDGRVLAVGRSGYGFETPRPLWSEQDPELWWRAAVEAIGSALGKAGTSGEEVAAVGLTGQMHGLVLLDKDDEVLRPAILWNDQRSEAECSEIRNRFGRERLIATTGNDALTGFTAPKLLWVRNHEPETFARASYMLLPKDFVRLRLTGGYAADRAGGSGTMLFDLAARDWSVDLVNALDLPGSILPPTFEGTDVTGVVSEQAAAMTGLLAGTPVVGGGGDQAANAVGVGAVEPGVAAASIGTSGVIFAAVGEPAFEPDGRLHAFCHAVPDTWHLMGVMLSAAGSYQWFKDAFAPDVEFNTLNEEAAATAPGAGGMVFLPYLSGERTPHADPTARGSFVGLTVRHGRGHLARAVMEGVAFGLRDSVQLMEGMVDLGEIRVSGGGASSAVWLGIIADVLGRPVRVVGTPESAAQGAALLAATGDGAFGSVAEACAGAVELGDVIDPGPGASVYDEMYPLYRDLYPALRDSFSGLSKTDR